MTTSKLLIPNFVCITEFYLWWLFNKIRTRLAKNPCHRHHTPLKSILFRNYRRKTFSSSTFVFPFPVIYPVSYLSMRINGKNVIKTSWCGITRWKWETNGIEQRTRPQRKHWRWRTKNVVCDCKSNKLMWKCGIGFIFDVELELKWHFCHTPSDVSQILIQEKCSRRSSERSTINGEIHRSVW